MVAADGALAVGSVCLLEYGSVYGGNLQYAFFVQQLAYILSLLMLGMGSPRPMLLWSLRGKGTLEVHL
jgi:hypothetical protein